MGEMALDINEVILKATRAGAQEGAKEALRKYKEEEQRKQKKERDKRLHDTKKLLQNYRKYKRIDAMNHKKLHMLGGDESIDYENMMWRNNQDAVYESFERTTKITHFDLLRFEWALKNWKLDCEKNVNRMYKTVQEVVYELYLRPLMKEETSLSIEEVADKYAIGRTTAFRYIQIAIEGIEPYLWGIDIR